MTENLRTTKFRTGEMISNVTGQAAWNGATFPAWCNYENNISYGTQYGHLYNWYAVNDSRKITPEGWHIPSDAEWTTLINYLSGHLMFDITIAQSLAAKNNWFNSSIFGSPGYDLFKNNTSGFNALPGGAIFSSGNFGDMGYVGYWWTSTEYSFQNALNRLLFNSTTDLTLTNYYSKNSGLSVRCVKD